MSLTGFSGVETYKCELAEIKNEIHENIVYAEEKANKTEETSDKFKCSACYKSFTTKASLKRHDERSPVCVKWKTEKHLEKIKYPQVPLHEFLEQLLEENYTKETDGSICCKYCMKGFSNKGNYNKHFSYSIGCQNMTYSSFKDKIKEKLFVE
jgi:uncharacterized Zn-finger protein